MIWVFLTSAEGLAQTEDSKGNNLILVKASSQDRVKGQRPSRSGVSRQAGKTRQVGEKKKLARKSQKKLAKSRKSKKKPIQRRKGQQKWTVASFNKLPLKHKLRLHGLVVATMSALEISRSGSPDARRTAFLQYLWSLGIPFAYGQSGGGCFFGGYFQENCRGGLIYNTNRCDLPKQGTSGGTELGVKCNPGLFPTAPCVYKRNNNSSNTGGRIRGYATTQACAYADAIRMKAFLNQTDDADAINSDALGKWASDNEALGAEDVLGADLWGVPIDPDKWMDKTNGFRAGLDEEEATAYYGLVQENLVGGLEDIKEKCAEKVTNWFEKKHCDFFQAELAKIQAIVDGLPPAAGDIGAAPAAETQEDNCLPFSQLPGEHFCQAKKGNDYLVLRLITTSRIGGVSKTAKAYKSTTPEGRYCEDTTYQQPENQVEQDSLASRRGISYSNLQSPLYDACVYDRRHKKRRSESNEAIFNVSYSPDLKFFIRKSSGPSNLCSFSFENSSEERDDKGNLERHSDDANRSYFLPGIKIDDSEYDMDSINDDLKMSYSNSRCQESDQVALYEADLIVRNHRKCAEKQVKTYTYVNESQAEDIEDWGASRHNHFGDNLVLKLLLQESDGNPKYYFGRDMSPPRKSRIDDSQIERLGRESRTITDWFYGDGADANHPLNLEDPNQPAHPGFLSGIKQICEDPPEASPSGGGSSSDIGSGRTTGTGD